MKQIPLVLVFVWLAPLPVSAESEPGIALKGGPNAATLLHDDRVDRYGFSGGGTGYLRWSLDDRFSLGGQIELLYTTRGAEVVSDGIPQGKLRQRYLDFMVAVNPTVRLGPMSIYFLLGGGMNLLASASSENASGFVQDATDDLRRVDVALLASTGIALHLPHREFGPVHLGTIFLEARYDRGLIDIDPMDRGFKNRTASLMLGLSFALSFERSAAQPAFPPAPSDPPRPATAAIPDEVRGRSASLR